MATQTWKYKYQKALHILFPTGVWILRSGSTLAETEDALTVIKLHVLFIFNIVLSAFIAIFPTGTRLTKNNVKLV